MVQVTRLAATPDQSVSAVGPVAFVLLQQSGEEARPRFKLLLNLLLSTGSRAVLRQLNPFLSAAAATTVLQRSQRCES